MENYEDIDIKRILEIILSKKLLIVLILLFSILFGYAYSYYYKKPEYKSSVTILLVADENKTNKELTQTDLNINNGLISTYSSIAKSTNVVQKTIENLELNMSASSLQKKVDAKQIDSTQFLKISVTNANPELAKNIANELAQVFTQQIKEIYNLQNISIVDEAEVESTPCNVNHMKDIIMFAFAGLFLAMVSVVAIFMFDDTIKSEEDIEKNVKLKAIGTLPVDKEKNELIVKNNPKSQIVESIKTIRTNILYSTNKNAILVTSCKQDEGKTWVINNLAVTFAQTGKRVILVDANLREESNKNDIFEIDKGEGLSDFIKEISEDNLDNLQKSRNYIKETKIPNLHILQNGTIPPNPVELVSSRNMKKIIKLLKNMYDVVLIDGTSSIMVSDSIALSSMVDSTILIAENKKTKINDLKKVKKLIEDVHGNILGVILNKAQTQKGKYYGKKYGYYYGSDVEKEIQKIEEKQDTISLDEVIELAKEKIQMQLPEDEILEEKERNLEFENNNDTNNETNNEIKNIRQEILNEIAKIKDAFIEFKRHDKTKKQIINIHNSINNLKQIQENNNKKLIENQQKSYKKILENQKITYKELAENQENKYNKIAEKQEGMYKQITEQQEKTNNDILEKIYKIQELQNTKKQELMENIQSVNEKQNENNQKLIEKIQNVDEKQNENNQKLIEKIQNVDEKQNENNQKLIEQIQSVDEKQNKNNQKLIEQIQSVDEKQNKNNQKLIEQIQSVKENQKEVKIQEEENVKILVEQFIKEINSLRDEIKELKESQNVNRTELLDKIDNMKYEEKLNEINEKLQEKETKNNIISFETLKRKKSNKKVFNINEESIGFEDLQRLSNCIVDLNDEVTSLEAMSN